MRGCAEDPGNHIRLQGTGGERGPSPHRGLPCSRRCCGQGWWSQQECLGGAACAWFCPQQPRRQLGEGQRGAAPGGQSPEWGRDVPEAGRDGAGAAPACPRPRLPLPQPLALHLVPSPAHRTSSGSSCPHRVPCLVRQPQSPGLGTEEGEAMPVPMPLPVPVPVPLPLPCLHCALAVQLLHATLQGSSLGSAAVGETEDFTAGGLISYCLFFPP